MQNSNLKNSLIAAGIAVFAGVVTLGANVAFGVTTPTQAPAAAGLIAPTFSGLDVRGGINNTTGDVSVSDNLNITGSVNNPAANNGFGGGSLKIGDDLDITGDIYNSKTADVTIGIGQTLKVLADIDVETTASIGSNLYVTGQAILQDILTVKKGINLDGGSITFSKSTYNDGTISNNNGNTIISSNNPVTPSKQSSITVHGDGTSNQVDVGTVGTKSNLTVNGAIEVISSLLSSPNLATNGTGGLLTLKRNANSIKGLHMEDNEITSFGSPLFLNYHDQQNVVVGTPGNLNAIDLQVNGNIKSTGKVTATSIGTYDIKQSNLTAYAPNAGILLKTPACDAGGQIISCDGQTYYNGALNYDVFIGTTESNKTTNVCTVGARNGAYNVKFQATALCFYPNK